MKKQKQSFKLLRVAVVSVLAMAALALTGCPNGNDTSAEPTPAPAPAVPITVTITGIPSRYHDSWGEFSLRHPGTGSGAGWDEVRVEGASASFSFVAVPGNFSLFLWLGNGSSSEYFIASRNITAGANTVPISAFTPLEDVTITVTGIPGRYIGSVDANMRLMHPGTFNHMSGRWSDISSSSATFWMRAVPGTYDVHLRFWYNNVRRAYSAPSVNITAGTNTIPFSDFSVVEPITITVTGIPSRYIGEGGGIYLNTPGIVDRVAEDWVWSRSIAASSSFTLFAMPGTYDVALWFEFEVGDDDWDFALYSVSRRNITAGTNTIPFSAFSRVPQMTITVTGLPERYIGNGNSVEVEVGLTQPGAGNWIAGSWGMSRGSSVRMNLWDRNTGWVFNTPGTYDVYLSFWWLSGAAYYLAPSRNITAGNTNIPFSAFTPAERGNRINALTEPPEPSERATRGRSRARAHSPRTR